MTKGKTNANAGAFYYNRYHCRWLLTTIHLVLSLSIHIYTHMCFNAGHAFEQPPFHPICSTLSFFPMMSSNLSASMYWGTKSWRLHPTLSSFLLLSRATSLPYLGRAGSNSLFPRAPNNRRIITVILFVYLFIYNGIAIIDASRPCAK